MFCLFRNSRILAPWHYWVLLLSLGGVVYWLHFAFIEKAFWQTVVHGQALFVDLLLGLPVVLIFAVVVYAMIYWSLKVGLIFLLPHTIEKLPDGHETLPDALPDDFEPPADDGVGADDSADNAPKKR